MDVQKNSQLRYNFTRVPETDPRACFNRATWSPAVNLQQPPMGTSHLILGDSLVRDLSNLRTRDLVGNHGDGLWRRDNSPVIPNGGTDESREHPQCDDPGWDE